MRSLYLYVTVLCALYKPVYSQVDSTLLYNTNTPFGALDIRLSRGKGHSYYLQQDTTFSFRQNADGPTNTYRKMTAWDSSPYLQGNMREGNELKDRFVMNYRLLPPQAYQENFDRGYPLVIVMHGFLERGNCAENNCYFSNKNFSPNENVPPAPTASDHVLLNNDYNLIHAGLDYLEARNANGERLPDDLNTPSGAFPGFVLFPQNLNGWDEAAAQDVIRLIRLVSKKYNIDGNRIYINGISHGGHGAYEILKRAPWMFAAAVMFSSADDAAVIKQDMAKTISHIPLWIFQGGLDARPSQRQTEDYIKAFRKAGAKVRYTLYPNLSHGTWNKALDEPDFFSWLLTQQRNTIHANGGTANICSSGDEGVMLSLPKGFKNYEWEYNGSLISGTGTNTYLAKLPGAYRGRFSKDNLDPEKQWSDWSNTLQVTKSPINIPEIKQIGTLLLPDLNNNPNARLQAQGDFPYYHWYKDGKPLSGVTDTTKDITIAQVMGGGAYSLRVAGFDGCRSPESAVKVLVFKNKAPLTLAPPVDFIAVATSPSEISLQWTDASEAETGFEIWRRIQEPAGSFSSWVMAALTPQDAFSFQDKDLIPASVYHYKIRAINETARSNYTPEAEQNVIVSTPKDVTLPSAPMDLTASQAGVNKIRLMWEPSDDNSSVREYIIFYEEDTLHTNSPDTTFILNGLKNNKDYSFSVKAVDQADNISLSSNLAQANTYLIGLYYEHSTGAWDNISMIDWSMAEFTGTVTDFTLAPKTQEDFFNFMFDGFLSIEKGGVYQFRLTSDDGSLLSLNDSLMISNDGIHNINTVTSPVQVLDSGAHRITLKYFDYVLSDTLLVEYKGPDSNGEWAKIPPEVLVSSLLTATGQKEHPAGEFNFSMYPNPVRQDRMHIQMFSASTEPVSFVMRNATGAVVYENIMDYDPDLDINLPDNIAPGLYIVSVSQASHSLNKRAIIIR